MKPKISKEGIEKLRSKRDKTVKSKKIVKKWDKKPAIASKSHGDSSNDPNSVIVSLIGNTAMFCDSHGDVLSVGCFDKTVSNGHITARIYV